MYRYETKMAGPEHRLVGLDVTPTAWENYRKFICTQNRTGVRVELHHLFDTMVDAPCCVRDEDGYCSPEIWLIGFGLPLPPGNLLGILSVTTRELEYE